MVQRLPSGYVFDPMLDKVLAGQEEAEQEALSLVRREGLVLAIEVLCEAFSIPLDDARRAHMEALDPAGIEALLAHLRTTRAWP